MSLSHVSLPVNSPGRDDGTLAESAIRARIRFDEADGNSLKRRAARLETLGDAKLVADTVRKSLPSGGANCLAVVGNPACVGASPALLPITRPLSKRRSPA